MMKRVILVLSLLLAAAAFGQGDPLRNLSGTAGSAGTETPWARSALGTWTLLHAFDAHVTYVTESGPEVQRNETFSTNWLALGVHRDFGGRGFLLLRGRVSLEPFTIPEEDGYPQMLQYVSPEAGGPLTDRMRAHDLLGEAAVQAGWRPTETTLVYGYAALAGDPALGAAPYAMRSSGIDFAEAPYAYDVQESFHDSTSVVTAGFATRFVTIEGSVFHDAVTFGDHTEIDSGDIDSNSVRVTLTPGSNLAFQASRGKLGEEAAERTITSASLSYGTPNVALTALWTRREDEADVSETAYGVEVALRSARNTFMGRAEWVDRPQGFPEPAPAGPLAVEQTTHFAVGYIFDFLSSARYRAGVGLNIDYHTQSHELPERYGHKPQAIYWFARLRTK